METLELPLPTPALPPTRHGFRLHPALDPSKYEMPGSLAGVARWKAFCYVGNDCGQEHVHEMQDVGYVMISLVDDTIVPIARGDEHHQGYDLMFDFASGEYATYGLPPARNGRRRRAKPAAGLDIRPRDYVAMWSGGTNYVYGPKDVAAMTEALRRWLSYGGRDGIVIGANDMRGRALSSRDMVERNGDFTVVPGTLAPIGADIVARLRKLSETLVALGPNPDRIAMADAFRQTRDLITTVEPFGYQIGFGIDQRKAALRRLVEVRRSGDSQKLWELAFGFDGIKHMMHAYLRSETESGSVFSRDHFSSIWGEPDLAIDILSRI